MKLNSSSKLLRIKALMFLSFSLLIAFSAHWLMSQYERERTHLQKDLGKLFESVQQDISDSLLWTNVAEPTIKADSSSMPGQGYEAIMEYRDKQLRAQGAYR